MKYLRIETGLSLNELVVFKAEGLVSLIVTDGENYQVETILDSKQLNKLLKFLNEGKSI